MISIVVNGKFYQLDLADETPLLWVLRDTLGLTGTKYGCDSGICGACTVLVNGAAVRSCLIPVSAPGGAVVTIEGLSEHGDHPVQQAWVAEQVPQCGYCQSGQIMAAAALLSRIPHPSDSDINVAMSGNLCRCGTYPRIRAAIHRAAAGYGHVPAAAEAPVPALEPAAQPAEASPPKNPLPSAAKNKNKAYQPR